MQANPSKSQYKVYFHRYLIVVRMASCKPQQQMPVFCNYSLFNGAFKWIYCGYRVMHQRPPNVQIRQLQGQSGENISVRMIRPRAEIWTQFLSNTKRIIYRKNRQLLSLSLSFLLSCPIKQRFFPQCRYPTLSHCTLQIAAHALNYGQNI